MLTLPLHSTRRVLAWLISAFLIFTPHANAQTSARQTGEENDPDVPPFARGIDKAEYLRQRGAYIDMLRGVPYETAYNPRVKAILEMQRQRADFRQSINAAAWTSLGPAPIPNGQTEGTTTAVSGRTTAIAIHPTNPNIIYVGTAQGGVYRSLDGGATWTAIFDDALSLAIGAITIAPSSTTTVYVGTGEPQGSCDSFFGVGVYRITNAESGSPTLSGPFNSNGVSDVMTGRAIGNIVVHPTNADTIFVSTTSGIGGIGCEASASLPTRGLYRSSNALTTCTFTQMTTSGTNASHVDVAMDPNNPNRVLCTVNGSPGGVYLSTNAMASIPTFTQTQSLTSVRAELALHSSGGVVTAYVASGESSGRLRRSADGGATWSAVLTAANGYCGGQCFYNIAIAVDPTNANNVMIGGNVTGASTRLIAKSTDGGTTFVNVATGVHADNHVVRYAPSDASVLYMGTDGGIYKSVNGGTTWTSLNSTGFSATQFQSIALHPTNSLFTIGGTQDNGTEWRKPDGSWTRADYGDGGYALIDQNAPDDVNVTMYHTYFNQTNAMGYAQVLTTLNASDDLWGFYGCGFLGAIPNGMTCSATAILFYAPMALGPGNPNTVYFGSDVLYRSPNLGVTMTKVSQEPITSGIAISSIGISPQNDNVRLVGLRNGKVYATTTGASPLTNISSASFPARFVARVAVDPNDVNTAYATFGGFGVAAGQHIWKTTNLNGAPPTWSASATGIPDVPVNAFVVDPTNSNNLFAGTDIGVYVSTDAGASWLPFGTGLPVAAVFDMAIHPVTRALRVATHGRGIWEISGAPLPVQLASFTATMYHQNDVLLSWRTLSEVNNYGFESERALERRGPYYTIPGSFIAGHGTTSIPHDYSYVDTTAEPRTWFYRLRQRDLDGSVHFSEPVEINTLTGVAAQQPPEEFGLAQNYPNPFNPTTKIRYALPAVTDVLLEVYNTLGQRVATLVDGKQGAGYHDVEFTASGIPSGVYYYRLKAGNEVSTRKMVVMK
ncbi:MAG: T9SS type A sorting domain-containing protein [Ignavibacteriae bacterium]|nr:T9SS type A sorting domain-containing protein [Ignavibacteriota bacterium]